MIRFASLALCLALLGGTGAMVRAPAAQALTLSGESHCSGSHGECGPGDFELVLTGAPGERNAVTLTGFTGAYGQAWWVEDATAPLVVQPSSGCAADGARRASCPAGWPAVGLGDGDDTLRMDGPWTGQLSVRGEAGDDAIDLSGSGSSDSSRSASLDGGPGDDTMVGTGQGDVVVLSAGHDRVTGINGAGPASDAKLWSDDASVWDVDLVAGTAIRGNDRTDVTGTARVLVGTGVVRGDEHDNWLTSNGVVDGRGGDDRVSGKGALFGGDGDDRIYAAGASTVDGGTGDDWISAAPRAPLVATCGAGRDHVSASPQAPPRVDATCELVALGRWSAGEAVAQPVESSRRVSVRISCAGHSATCRGRVRVSGLPGSVAYAVPPGRTGVVRVAKRGHRPERRAGRIRVTVGAGHETEPHAWWAPPRRAVPR